MRSTVFNLLQWIPFLAMFSDLFPKLIRTGKQLLFSLSLSHCSGPPHCPDSPSLPLQLALHLWGCSSLWSPSTEQIGGTKHDTGRGHLHLKCQCMGPNEFQIALTQELTQFLFLSLQKVLWGRYSYLLNKHVVLLSLSDCCWHINILWPLFTYILNLRYFSLWIRWQSCLHSSSSTPGTLLMTLSSELVGCAYETTAPLQDRCCRL